MLNIKFLSYFVATAKHGSFSRAAERINISKSAIVRAVDLLEEDCQTKLFVRERAKGVVLTNDGEHLLQMCQVLFRDIKNLEAKMSDLGTVSGELVLTCIESLAACIIPDLTVRMMKSYPTLQIRTIEAFPEHALDLIRQGEADVMISARAISQRSDLPKWLEYEVLMQLMPCVTLAHDHPLARKARITMEDLLRHRMIVMSQPYITQLAMLYFRRINRFPDVAYETNTIENLRAMIGKGLGYGITHFKPMVDRSFTGDRLVTRNIYGVAPGIEIIVAYASRNDDWIPRKTKAFLHETRNYFKSSQCANYFSADRRP